MHADIVEEWTRVHDFENSSSKYTERIGVFVTWADDPEPLILEADFSRGLGLLFHVQTVHVPPFALETREDG